ncbi:MAG: hypothetical protein ACR2MP_23955, partial [Streptosporangiaceae bacterium]
AIPQISTNCQVGRRLSQSLTTSLILEPAIPGWARGIRYRHLAGLAAEPPRACWRGPVGCSAITTHASR